VVEARIDRRLAAILAADIAGYNVGLAAGHYLARHYRDAIDAARKAVQQHSTWAPGHRNYCASLAQAGQLEAARTALDRLKELQPDISIIWIQQNLPYARSLMASFVEGMRKAGLQ
jgi:tetratricopeptide (TPR) repeat protein